MKADFSSATTSTGSAAGGSGLQYAAGDLNLARRDLWPVGRIVRHTILQCPAETPVAGAARMMADAGCSSIIVTAGGKPVGIWTERDALALDLANPQALTEPVRDRMSSPILTMPETTTIEAAMPRFREQGVRHFLVVDADGAPVGVLSRTDVVRNSGLHGYLTLRTVDSVATRAPLTVPLDASIAETARALRGSDAEAAVVVDANGLPWGIVTERDVLRLVARQDIARPVREIASRPVVSVPRDAPLLHAQELMESRHIRHLAVEDSLGAVVAVLSFTDILKGIEVDYLRHLQDAVTRQMEAIETGRTRQRAILDLTQEGYAEVDGDCRLVDCNAAFERLLGAGRGRLIGLPLPALAEREAARALEAGFAAAVRPGAPPHHTFETVLRRDDGDSRVVHVAVTALRDAEGTTTGAFGFFTDITDVRAGEMRQKALLEQVSQSNAELEAFAFVVSHDLQEPLRMVTSYLQLVERRLGDSLDPETREFMAFASGGAARAQSMVMDLLDYSRIDRKGRPFEDCNAAAALESAVRRLDTALTRSGARVTWDTLPQVHADFPQVVRLFQHLLDNAVKFRDPERPPRIHVSCEAEAEGPAWRFHVRDNGIGIDPRFSDRIFQMFQRLHARGTYAGNGIGLAICKRIVERHGGTISVESRPGKGSTFTFTLRDLRPAQPEEPA